MDRCPSLLQYGTTVAMRTRASTLTLPMSCCTRAMCGWSGVRRGKGGKASGRAVSASLVDYAVVPVEQTSLRRQGVGGGESHTHADASAKCWHLGLPCTLRWLAGAPDANPEPQASLSKHLTGRCPCMQHRIGGVCVCYPWLLYICLSVFANGRLYTVCCQRHDFPRIRSVCGYTVDGRV